MTLRMRLIAATCGVLAASLAGPAAAGAIVVAPATDCPEPTIVSPFEPWNDARSYARVEDGGFEGGAAGWRLDRAQVVDDNRPWPVGSTVDARALEVRGSATAPGFCVGLAHPTIRFFARNTGSVLGALRVDAIVTTSLGLKVALPIGVVLDGSQQWRPTPSILMLANLLPLVPGQMTRVSFRFSAVGLGSSWRIDDVYVDPYSKR